MRPLRRLMAKLSAPGAELAAHKPELGAVTIEDVDAALSVTKPSARLLEEKYAKFSAEYGQVA